MIKVGDIVWKVNETDTGPELASYEITKVGKIHIWYVQLGLPKKQLARRVLSKDFFRNGMYFSPESCVAAFDKQLAGRIIMAQNKLYRLQDEYNNFRATLGKTIPGGSI